MEETTIGPSSSVKAVDTDAGKEGNPIWLGVKLLLVDMGISLVFGLIIGVVFLAAGMSPEQLTNHPLAIGFGLMVSVYAVFLLYRQYSKDIKALIAIILGGLIFGAMTLTSGVAGGNVGLSFATIIMIAQTLSFLFGWYLAKTTSIRLFLLPGIWVTIFFVGGIIFAFLLFLGFISAVAA